MYTAYKSNKGIKMALESALLCNILNTSNQMNIYTVSKSEAALFSSDNFKNMLKDTFSNNEKSLSKDIEKKKSQALSELTQATSNNIASLIVDNCFIDNENENLSSIYDGEPIFTEGNDGQCIRMLSSNFLNKLISNVNCNSLSIDSSIQSLLYISSLLKDIKISSTDISNLTLLNQVKVTTASYNPIPYFLPLYIVGLNLLHYINRTNQKTFDYKKEKQKMYEKMKQQEKEKKEKMLEFAAGFQCPLL